MTDLPVAPLDLPSIRADFPILGRTLRPGVPLVYLDSTATTQKPQAVLDAMQAYYQQNNANIHRGVHTLAEEATLLYEQARQKVADFIHAANVEQVIFTRNTTESINLVAQSWGRTFLQPGDCVVLTEMEHHANLVPWQMLAAERGVNLEFIAVRQDGLLDLAHYQQLLARGPKLVAFAHVSNVLGTINPAQHIIQLAHQAGALTLLDAAQSAPHLPLDVQALDADFVAFSAHKMLGPTGIAVLYGKAALLEAMPPFLGGGDMIKRVHLRSFVANDLPYKFEAGTPAIAEAIGFGAAIDYLQAVGLPAIHAHEQALVALALAGLADLPGVRVLGPSAAERGGLVSFAFDSVHPHDVAQVLDRLGIAVRAGHHCAQPLHDKFGLMATTRASFYLYSTPAEVSQLLAGLGKVLEMFA